MAGFFIIWDSLCPYQKEIATFSSFLDKKAAILSLRFDKMTKNEDSAAEIPGLYQMTRCQHPCRQEAHCQYFEGFLDNYLDNYRYPAKHQLAFTLETVITLFDYSDAVSHAENKRKEYVSSN